MTSPRSSRCRWSRVPMIPALAAMLWVSGASWSWAADDQAAKGEPSTTATADAARGSGEPISVYSGTVRDVVAQEVLRPDSLGGGAIIRARAEALASENAARARKLASYVVGKTMVGEFVGDGWSVHDPYQGRLGVIGIVHGPGLDAGKTTDVFLGFTYRLPEGEADPTGGMILKMRLSSLKTELSSLAKDGKTIWTSVAPPMIYKGGKAWTVREWDEHGGPEHLEPLFESVALVRFRRGVLERVDLSGLRCLDLSEEEGEQVTP